MKKQNHSKRDGEIMNKKNIILIVLLVLVIVLSIFAILMGMKAINASNANSNNGINLKKSEKTYSLTLDDMYCNVKESKRIVKVNVTIETYLEKTLETLNTKEYLIRDNINQIIRNKTEEELEGKEGQIALQKEIKDCLIKLFNDESIINVYFNDFVMQ